MVKHYSPGSADSDWEGGGVAWGGGGGGGDRRVEVGILLDFRPRLKHTHTTLGRWKPGFGGGGGGSGGGWQAGRQVWWGRRRRG